MRFSRPAHYSVRYNTLFPLYRRLPWRAAYRMAAWQAGYFQRRYAEQQAVIREQMQQALPDASEEQLTTWVRDFYRMQEQEALDTWFLDSPAIPELVSMHGFEAVAELRAAGKRVLLTGGHYGRFWLAGPAMRRAGHRVGTVTRDGGAENSYNLHPAEYQYRLFKLKKLARVLGGPFLLEGKDLRPLYQELDSSLITLIFDVPYPEKPPGSVTVPFFDGSINVPAGIYKIAKKTQAWVVPFYVCDSSSGGEVAVAFSEPLEPNNYYNDEEFMSLLANELERHIKMHPGSWWLWEALPLLRSNNHGSDSSRGLKGS